MVKYCNEKKEKEYLINENVMKIQDKNVLEIIK